MMDLASRSLLVQSLLADDGLPPRVTEAFFARHPERGAQLGPAGRRRCTEDARVHLSFLAGAVQAGSPEIFAEYATWCAEMLAAGHVASEPLAEHLELLESCCDLSGDTDGLVRKTIAAARDALGRATVPKDPAPADDQTSVRRSYLSAAIAGRRLDAWEATRLALREGQSVGSIYKDVLIWSQRRLGELWSGGHISVAQEHMASAVTQSVVARLYAEIGRAGSVGRALVAGVEGELHTLPAQLASDLLELDGWDVAFVGTNVPTAAVLEAMSTERPDVVGLSTTMTFNLPKTVALVTALRRQFPDVPIVLGGRAVHGAAALAKELKVDVDALGDGSSFRAYARAK